MKNQPQRAGVLKEEKKRAGRQGNKAREQKGGRRLEKNRPRKRRGLARHGDLTASASGSKKRCGKRRQRRGKRRQRQRHTSRRLAIGVAMLRHPVLRIVTVVFLVKCDGRPTHALASPQGQ